MTTKTRKFHHSTINTEIVITYSFTPRGRFLRGYAEMGKTGTPGMVPLASLEAVEAASLALLLAGFEEVGKINLPPKPTTKFATEGKVHKGQKVDTRAVYHPGGALYSHPAAELGTVEDFLPGGGLAVRFHGKDGATTVADFTKSERAKIIVMG